MKNVHKAIARTVKKIAARVKPDGHHYITREWMADQRMEEKALVAALRHHRMFLWYDLLRNWIIVRPGVTALTRKVRAAVEEAGELRVTHGLVAALGYDARELAAHAGLELVAHGWLQKWVEGTLPDYYMLKVCCA